MKKKIIAVAIAAFVVIGVMAMSSFSYLNKAKSAPARKIQEHNDAVNPVTAEIDSLMGGSSSSNNRGSSSQSWSSYGETHAQYDDSWSDYGDTYTSETELWSMEDFNTEEYNMIKENGFVKVADTPLSTFAADVDTGTYCNLRRMVNGGWSLNNLAGSIRTEEMVNYFDYTVESTDNAFSVQYSVGDCPWNEGNKLLFMTMQANSDTTIRNKGNNFVYLIDSSGSMDIEDKLPLVKESFKLLAETMGPKDRISIVTYAGSSETLLEGSNDYDDICDALDRITAYGGTNGSGGIEAAYRCAEKNFIKGGNNRVIIASDGDMNLGITSQSGLVDLIKEEKETGVFLTVLGYGSGNYSDANMESLADAGNGNYFYIDSIEEAERVLCEKLKQTTVTVAKDVKFQVEFNPAEVYEYRQIGYENRQMSASDFNDDTKDGGEVGAGAQVTVCYEIVPRSEGQEKGGGLKYQEMNLNERSDSGELCTVSVRYKDPDSDKSKLLEYPLMDNGISNKEDFNFICGVIETSLVLRDSEYKGDATYDSAYQLAMSGTMDNQYREEFCELIKKLGADA